MAVALFLRGRWPDAAAASSASITALRRRRRRRRLLRLRLRLCRGDAGVGVFWLVRGAA